MIAGANSRLDADTRYWVATNLCAAANDAQTDPALLGAYILTENGKLDLWSIRSAGRGNDHGLFQINSYYQRHRPQLAQVHHPYYGALTAARVLQDNLRQFGWTWQAFAAYWSQAQALRGSAEAKDYYRRFQANHAKVQVRFRQAEKIVKQNTLSRFVAPRIGPAASPRNVAGRTSRSVTVSK
jgi:hypothetical protein